MLAVGDLVRVLAPFADSFPDSYEITEVVTHPDGQIVCILGECGGFDPKYLEAAE